MPARSRAGQPRAPAAARVLTARRTPAWLAASRRPAAAPRSCDAPAPATPAPAAPGGCSRRGGRGGGSERPHAASSRRPASMPMPVASVQSGPELTTCRPCETAAKPQVRQPDDHAEDETRSGGSPAVAPGPGRGTATLDLALSGHDTTIARVQVEDDEGQPGPQQRAFEPGEALAPAAAPPRGRRGRAGTCGGAVAVMRGYWSAGARGRRCRWRGRSAQVRSAATPSPEALVATDHAATRRPAMSPSAPCEASGHLRGS
jgi:hypothetical protein